MTNVGRHLLLPLCWDAKNPRSWSLNLVIFQYWICSKQLGGMNSCAPLGQRRLPQHLLWRSSFLFQHVLTKAKPLAVQHQPRISASSCRTLMTMRRMLVLKLLACCEWNRPVTLTQKPVLLSNNFYFEESNSNSKTDSCFHYLCY